MENKRIKLIIAEPFNLIRHGYSVMFNKEKSLKVIGLVANGKELLELIHIEKPDVALFPLEMPEMNGLEALKETRIKFPSIKCIVLYEEYQSYLEPQLLGLGAYKSLLTSGDFDIFKILEESKNDFVPQEKPKEFINPIIFSEQEIEVLNLMCLGESTEQIATALKIAVADVELCEETLYKKTKTKNFLDLLRFAKWNETLVNSGKN